MRRKSELAEIIEKITFHFHFDFVHDNLKCLQFHVHRAELCLGGSNIKFEVEYFIELVAFGHVFDFLFGWFLEHFEFVDFGVDFVEEVVVFVDAFVEGLSEAGDGLVELLATDKMVLALDHWEGGHDSLFEHEQLGFEFIFDWVHFALEGPRGISQLADLAIHLAQFVWVTKTASGPWTHGWHDVVDWTQLNI